MFAVVALVTAAALVPRAAAQTPGPIEPREGWTEEWQDERPVSGGLRMGVMAQAGRDEVDPRALTVAVPGDHGPVLCVRVNSQDHRYRGEFEYDVAGLPPRTYTLRIPTEHASRLKSYPPAQLAALAYFGEDCSQEPAAFAVASWGTIGEAGTVEVFLNSDYPTFVVGGADGRVEHEVRCRRIDGETVAYNLRCELDAAWITPGAAFFVLLRSVNGSEYVPLPIALP